MVTMKSERHLVRKVLPFAGAISPQKTRLYKIYQKSFEKLVNEGTDEELQSFLDAATDEEVVSYLGDCSLRAPLLSEYYRIFMLLMNRVFADKIDLPDDLLQENRPLDSYHESLLRNMRTDIRRQQFKQIKALA